MCARRGPGSRSFRRRSTPSGVCCRRMRRWRAPCDRSSRGSNRMASARCTLGRRRAFSHRTCGAAVCTRTAELGLFWRNEVYEPLTRVGDHSWNGEHTEELAQHRNSKMTVATRAAVGKLFESKSNCEIVLDASEGSIVGVDMTLAEGQNAVPTPRQLAPPMVCSVRLRPVAAAGSVVQTPLTSSRRGSPQWRALRADGGDGTLRRRRRGCYRYSALGQFGRLADARLTTAPDRSSPTRARRPPAPAAGTSDAQAALMDLGRPDPCLGLDVRSVPLTVLWMFEPLLTTPAVAGLPPRSGCWLQGG